MEGGPSLELLVGHALARVDEAGEVCDRLEAETKQAVHSLESRLQASAEATVQALEQRMSLALGGLRHSEDAQVRRSELQLRWQLVGASGVTSREP